MGKIVDIPLINKMKILSCDLCKEVSLNLYINDDLTCLAYRCIPCGNVGYFYTKDEGEEIKIIKE